MLTCFAGCQNSKNGVAEIIIVGYTIYEPMNYKDDSGKLVGFDTELAEKVFGNQVISQADISSATLSRVSRCVQYGHGYSRFLKP